MLNMINVHILSLLEFIPPQVFDLLHEYLKLPSFFTSCETVWIVNDDFSVVRDTCQDNKVARGREIAGAHGADDRLILTQMLYDVFAVKCDFLCP